MHRISALSYTLVLLCFGLGRNECCFAQNLVPNPSFEIHDTCPNSLSQLNYCTFWNNPTWNSPDYFNACAIDGMDTTCDVPRNYWGFQNGRTGIGYTGIACYTPSSPNQREYLEVQLTDSLMKDKEYEVNFYVSLANGFRYGVDNIGAHLSFELVNSSTIFDLPYPPQVRSPTGFALMDTSGWMIVSDTIVAQGGERYLTIGTFAPDSQLVLDSIVTSSGQGAYYYIDDISVVELPTGIGGEKHHKPFEAKVFPNPANGDVQIVYSDALLNSCSFKLMNLLGKTVLLQEIEKQSGTLTLNTSNLPAGIYFYEIDVHDLTSSKGKFVIVH